VFLSRPVLVHPDRDWRLFGDDIDAQRKPGFDELGLREPVDDDLGDGRDDDVLDPGDDLELHEQRGLERCGVLDRGLLQPRVRQVRPHDAA
jgi:hypothetical protein